MNRNTLAAFLRNLVLASLPAALSSCCQEHNATFRATVDAAVVESSAVGDGGALPLDVCTQVCREGEGKEIRGVYQCRIATTSDAGIASVDCDERVAKCAFVAGGRPPAGLRARHDVRAFDPIGVYFAEMAHVESAAVMGFEQLAEELLRFGAPAHLVSAAVRASQDENRHARIASAFARRYGAESPSIEIDPAVGRSLEDLAIDNCVEGCVIETYGAVVTTWQAQTASDLVIRRAFAKIAEDELRHAELAFAVARWSEPLLNNESRSRLLIARDAAVEQLLSSLDTPPPRALAEQVGLPSPGVAQRLTARLRKELWS